MLRITRFSCPLFVCLFLISHSVSAQQAVSGQTFADWTVRCDPRADGDGEQCFIFQNLVLKESGQRVLHVAVGYLPNRQVPMALITLPLGISLPPGGAISIDNQGEPIAFQIERCEKKGCRAGLLLQQDLLEQLRAGAEATVTFHDGARKPISAPLSLRGFSAGLSALEAIP